MIVGIPLVSLILCFVIFPNTQRISSWQSWSVSYAVSLVYTAAFWLSFRAIILDLRKRQELRNNTRKRLLLEIILVLLAFVIIDGFLDWLVNFLLQDPAEHLPSNPTIELFSTLIISFFICSLYEIFFIQKQLEHTVLEWEQLSKANMQSQLEGLKNQIQPHFLFNSLNALAGLIPTDSKRAVRYVNQLSQVFRYFLDIDNTPLISLEQELSFLQSYIYLLKERFGKNLIVEIRVNSAYHHKMIVPLSLQILFENAVKHNILSSRHPLHVSIYINDEEKITVENNLQLKDMPPSSTKIGLDNIQRRYGFFVEDSVDIVSNEESFLVALPLISAPEIMPVMPRSIA